MNQTKSFTCHCVERLHLFTLDIFSGIWLNRNLGVITVFVRFKFFSYIIFCVSIDADRVLQFPNEYSLQVTIHENFIWSDANYEVKCYTEHSLLAIRVLIISTGIIICIYLVNIIICIYLAKIIICVHLFLSIIIPGNLKNQINVLRQ